VKPAAVIPAKPMAAAQVLPAAVPMALLASIRSFWEGNTAGDRHEGRRSIVPNF
jgi:hypothetical protein